MNRLDAAHAEWVRRFVAMALLDAEPDMDEADPDSDTDMDSDDEEAEDGRGFMAGE